MNTGGFKNPRPSGRGEVKGRMVLLHGFVKKSQKTPADDLKTALVRLRKL